MSDFFVGQKVVCVDDRPGARPGTPVVKGKIYQIAALIPDRMDATLGLSNQTLCEILGTERRFRYGLWRFKPLDSKGIEIFRKIAQDVTDGKVVEIVDA